MTSKPEYIRFEEIESLPYAKTHVWKILSVSHGGELGRVSWYNRWRQYVFFPNSGTLYNQGCLLEIRDFVQKATHDHREAQKKERTTR